jgi:hypothetical protein
MLHAALKSIGSGGMDAEVDRSLAKTQERICLTKAAPRVVGHPPADA